MKKWNEPTLQELSVEATASTSSGEYGDNTFINAVLHEEEDGTITVIDQGDEQLTDEIIPGGS